MLPTVGAFVALLATLWLVATPVAAEHGGAHRYVDAATGDDANLCTEAEPCASIARAIVVAAAGDVIEIAAGVYEEDDGLHSGTALRITKNVTLRGAGDGSTFIQPAAGNNHRVMFVNFNITVTIERVTIRNGLLPLASDGAGILSRGTLHLDRSTVTNNRVSGDGSGGGLAFPEGGISTITNSTISGNRATRGAGGVFVTQEIFDFPSVVIRNTTIANNTSDDDDGHGVKRGGGTLTLHNTIVANGDADNCEGVFTASNLNIATDGTCDSATQVTAAALNLGALADNGGPTQTHALLAGSAAIDHADIDAGECPSTDQRGESRPQGERCDAGAFEFVPVVASDDATLSSLAAGAGALSPAFDAATTAYTVDTAHATTSTTVTPTANDGNATITVNGTAVDSGVASDTIALDVGGNTITIVVTAEDGTTTETYTITVTRAAAPPPPPDDEPPPPEAAPPEMIATTGGVLIPVVEQVTVDLAPPIDLSLVAPNGASVAVTVPAGALDDAEADGLQLAIAAIDDVEAVSEQAPRPAGADAIVKFAIRVLDADGATAPAQFSVPVSLAFTVPEDLVSGGTTGDTLTIAFWDGTEWITVEGEVMQNEDGSFVVTASVSHFTLFSLKHVPALVTFTPEPFASVATAAIWGGGGYALLGEALDGGAAWALVDGTWHVFAAALPDFVTASFRAAYPDGLPFNEVVTVAAVE